MNSISFLKSVVGRNGRDLIWLVFVLWLCMAVFSGQPILITTPAAHHHPPPFCAVSRRLTTRTQKTGWREAAEMGSHSESFPAANIRASFFNRYRDPKGFHWLGNVKHIIHRWLKMPWAPLLSLLRTKWSGFSASLGFHFLPSFSFEKI